MNIKSFLLMAAILVSGYAAAQDAPRGNLIYCSYSQDRVAGLGKSYCELIADPGSEPTIRVVLDQNSRLQPQREAEFKVESDVVTSLQEKLAQAEAYKLDGFVADEHLEGGTVYRIHMEYDSGEKITAWWHAHNVSPDAIAAYALIRKYFEPWRTKADSQTRQ